MRNVSILVRIHYGRQKLFLWISGVTFKDCLYQVLAPVIGRYVDMTSTGSLHCRLLVIMVAMLTRGDRLVELKVTMLNIALDVGKCS